MNIGPTRFRAARGFTLVELMVSLSIFSVMAMAIMAMMFSLPYNTNQNVRSESNLVTPDRIGDAERIIDNTRSASTLGPSFSATCLDEFTQPDPDHSNIKYDVQYYINVQGQLVETHDLYGTNVLLPDATSFSVVVLQGTTPTMIQISIVASDGANTVSRTCDITSRNF